MAALVADVPAIYISGHLPKFDSDRCELLGADRVGEPSHYETHPLQHGQDRAFMQHMHLDHLFDHGPEPAA
jgi:hypothetical protein